MNQQLKTNVILPELPFVDRKEHLDKIVKIFEDKSGNAINLALLDGEGGLGKSELVKRASDLISEECLVVWLPAASYGKNNKSIYENAMLATLNALGKATKLGKAAHKKQALMNIIDKALPNVSKDASQFMDVESKTITGLGQSVMSGILSYYNVDSIDIRTRLNSLFKQLWRENVKLVFIVDDVHELTFIEGNQLVAFINSIGSIENSGPWTVFMTSRPVQEFLQQRLGLSAIWDIRNSWSLEHWTIKKLEKRHMHELAELYIQNLNNPDILVRESRGNPRQFFSIIQKLALQHLCSVSEQKITLEGDVNDVVVLDNTFESTLHNDRMVRFLCGALVLGSEKVPLRVLSEVGKQCDPSQIEYAEKLKLLSNTSYLKECENELGESCLRLQDDSKIEIVNKILEINPMDKYLLHKVLTDGYLSYFSEDAVKSLLELGNPSRKIQKDIISTPYISYYIQACAHAAFSGYPNAHLFAVSSLRILDKFTRFAELVNHYHCVATLINKVFDELNEFRLFVRCLLSKSYYHIGEFEKCASSLHWNQIEAITSSEYLYYHVMSIIIAKKETNPSKKTQKILEIVENKSFKDKSWLPQIVTAHAFAYQEYGDYATSVNIYFQYYLKTLIQKKNSNTHTFGLMSPLFLPVRAAKLACNSAYKYFLKLKNLRMAGMALHNLGYCHMRNLDFDKAYEIFSEANKVLSENAEEEAGFAKVNMGFIHLIRKEPIKAKSFCSDALKYFRSPFYISAARVNLAIADWQLGNKTAAEHLDQIPQTTALLDDPRQNWRIIFNKAFIFLKTKNQSIKQETVNALFLELKSLSDNSLVCEYWNNLINDLASDYPDIDWPYLPDKSNSKLGFISTKIAPYRASTLCFGHA